MRLRGRVWLVALIGGGIGCHSAPPTLLELTATGTSKAARITMVFNPASCSFTTAELEPLNELYEKHHVAILGVSLISLDDSVRQRIRRQYGIRFPLTSDSLHRWRAALGRGGLAQPLVIVEKRGALQAVLQRDGIERLAPLLATLFAVQLESSHAAP